MNERIEPQALKPQSLSARSIMAGQHVHITPAEWRWVVIVSCILALVALLPLMWIALLGVNGWQFMGVLHNYLDGATYFAKMGLGQNGAWLVTFMHTPETHSGAFIQVLYLALGHISRLTGVPTGILFHLGRILAALIMYAAIYQLGAAIWSRIRPRRIFFGIASIGSGLGWLFAPLTGELIFPDFPLLPEAFPFFSTLMNVHFPLTIALLAIMATFFILVFRPGMDQDASLKVLWPAASFMSLGLSMLYPQALVPLCGALAAYAISLVWAKQSARLIWRWVLAVIIPAVPMAAYYGLIVAYNPAMQIWNQQNQTPSPPLYGLILGYGLPLFVAIPALVRAIRRFERDGDRFMLLWLAIIVVAMYLPINVQRRFGVGMMIPIAYFGARAIEDVWLPLIQRRWRMITGVVFFFLISISMLLMLFLPAIPVAIGNLGQSAGIYLEADYASVLNEINRRTSVNDVVLASPVVSAWLPGWASVRSVYGHPYETLNAEEKLAEVEAWYGAATTEDCAELLERYNVRYVIGGPQEALLGAGACLTTLRVIGQAGSVTIYAP